MNTEMVTVFMDIICMVWEGLIGAYLLRTYTAKKNLKDEEKAEKVLDNGILEQVESLEGVDRIATDYVEVTQAEEPERFLAPYAELQALYSGAEEEEVWSDLRFKAVGLSIEELREFTWNSTLPDEEIQSCLASGTGIFLVETEGADFKELTGKKIQVNKNDGSGESIAYTIVELSVDTDRLFPRPYQEYLLNVINGNSDEPFFSYEYITKTPLDQKDLFKIAEH